MAKLTLDDLTTSFGSQGTINANNDKIEQAMENTLSRDGTSPNSMAADLDMDGNDILNAGSVQADSLTVNGEDVTDSVASAAASAAAAATSASEASTSEANAAASASSAAADAALLGEWRGAWATSTSYSLGDRARESGSTYICLEAHTSGTFNTDLVAGKWEIFAQKGDAGAGAGDMQGSNNLSDVSNVATARTNLDVPSKGSAETVTGKWNFQNDAGIRVGGSDENGIRIDSQGHMVLDVNNPSEDDYLKGGFEGFKSILKVPSTEVADYGWAFYFSQNSAGGFPPEPGDSYEAMFVEFGVGTNIARKTITPEVQTSLISGAAVSSDSDFTNDTTKLASRATIKTLVDEGLFTDSGVQLVTSSNEFTGLTVNEEITIFLADVALNTLEDMEIQLSTGASFVTTGYESSLSRIYNSTAIREISTTGFTLTSRSDVSFTHHGFVTFKKLPGTQKWAATGSVDQANQQMWTGGYLALGTALDGIRLSAKGSAAFTGGTIAIRYK